MALDAVVLGCGFIGLNFIEFALQRGYKLRVLDHNDCPKKLENKLIWVKGDLSNELAVRKLLSGADLVFHFISSTVPGDVVDESCELIQNVAQTLQLLKLCVQEKIRRIVFISSASVYGIQTVLPIPETATTHPICSHGIHKLTIEKYLQLYQYQHGLDCKILRLSNPYGPGQRINGRQGVIAIAIGKILADEPILIRGDGEIIRDFVYIDDVSEALHLIAISQTEESIFNVGSGEGYSLNQLIKLIEGITEMRLFI